MWTPVLYLGTPWCAARAITLCMVRLRSDGTIFSIYLQKNCQNYDTFESAVVIGTQIFHLSRRGISRSGCITIGTCAAMMDMALRLIWKVRIPKISQTLRIRGDRRQNVTMRIARHCGNYWQSLGNRSRKVIRIQTLVVVV